LKRIQSVNIDWSFERKRFKEIGSEDFVEDIHLKRPNLTLSTNYYYSNGTNEAVLGLDVDGASRGAVSYIRKENQDRNLYLIMGSGVSDEPLKSPSFKDSYDVMGLGNCFLNSYSLSASLGRPIDVSTSLSAYNLKLDVYDDIGGKGIPAIDTSIGEPTNDGHNFKITSDNIVNTSNLDGLIDAALPPSEIYLNLPVIDVPGAQLSGNNVISISSMNVGFNINRLEGEGFGSMYPYGSKTILPLLGNLDFSATTSEFNTGYLHDMISSGESSFDFTFNFRNCSGSTGLQVQVEGAKLDSQSQRLGIGGNAETQLDFKFSISDKSGLRMSTPPLFLENVSGAVTGPASGPVSVTATGKTPFTYSWYKNDAVIGGATNSSYDIPANGNYYVLVYNELGSGQSRTCVATNY